MEKGKRFRDLFPGQRFEFDHSKLTPGHAVMSGPWIKLSARRYKRSETLEPHYTVGTVAVAVKPLP